MINNSINMNRNMNNSDQESSNYELCLNQELRHIEGSKLTKLSAIIDNSKDYDRLLEELTRPQSRLLLNGKPSECLNLSMDAINLIKHQIHCGKSPTMALLNHWAITGRRRPTVRTLLAYLRLCNMRRAENYVCIEILGLKPESIMRPIGDGERPLPIQSPLDDNIVTIEDIYKFDDLNNLAGKLSPQCDRTKSGSKIGEGRFSSVYRASTKLVSDKDENEVKVVGAKLLKSECNKAYLVNEINLIGRVDHENVLKLLGIALGGKSQNESLAFICLIYPYMENGSLLDCLSEGVPVRDSTFLNWSERVIIATKLARGISYLHNFEEGPIIHRDIKTANILLDKNLEPKLGDFTIVRQINNTSMTSETQYSQNIIGTSVYMPPEAFRGDISIKFDSFSFGIVLLELLTGMRPFNEEQNEDLLTFITDRLSDLEDNFSSSQTYLGLMGSGIVRSSGKNDFEQAKDKFLIEILDKRAGNVDSLAKSCKTIFGLAMRATESRKNSRPTIDEIVPHLEELTARRE